MHRLWLAGIAGLLLVFSLPTVGAASANLSHSYGANEQISSGSLVSLDPKNSDYVVLANSDNGSRLIGVAEDSNDSLLAVDPTPGKVQVATSGTANVLVSTIAGPIKVGDEVGVSPFSGLGMKAAPGSRIIGLAQTAFDKNTSGAITQSVTDKSRQSHQVSIGYVRINIAISTDGTPTADSQLNSLQRLAKTLTGHTVPTLRVVISMVVALLAMLLLVTLIYAAIYGSIISIGRNPLAKYAVFRTLGSVVGLALVTAVVSGVTVFFLLR